MSSPLGSPNNEKITRLVEELSIALLENAVAEVKAKALPSESLAAYELLHRAEVARCS